MSEYDHYLTGQFLLWVDKCPCILKNYFDLWVWIRNFHSLLAVTIEIIGIAISDYSELMPKHRELYKERHIFQQIHQQTIYPSILKEPDNIKLVLLLSSPFPHL